MAPYAGSSPSLQGALLEAGEAAAGVGLPAALGVFAVVDDVDAVLVLQAHDFLDGGLDALLQRGVEGVAVACGPA